MKYTIYEDPISHQFAHLPLPRRFIDGDPLPSVAAERWFESHADAIAALPELLSRDEEDAVEAVDRPPPADPLAPTIAFSPRWHIPWARH